MGAIDPTGMASWDPMAVRIYVGDHLALLKLCASWFQILFCFNCSHYKSTGALSPLGVAKAKSIATHVGEGSYKNLAEISCIFCTRALSE